MLVVKLLLSRLLMMIQMCMVKSLVSEIERQGEFGLGSSVTWTQNPTPLLPSTNTSHTTHVKHTGYQVNIYIMKVMFQVTIINIVQYICSVCFL